MKSAKIIFTFLLLLFSLGQEALAQEKIKVAVSISAQRFLVNQIAGEEIEVEVLIKPGQEPHTFEVTPKQMVNISKARVLFVIGFPFERSLVAKLKTINPGLKIVDTAKGIKKRMMAEHGHDHIHQHEDEEEADPHSWLSPSGLEVHARNIYQALAELKPASKAIMSKNLEKFLQLNEETAKAVMAKLKDFKGMEFFVFHPSFGYFADYCGMTQVAVEAEGKRPTAKQLSNLIKKARKLKTPIIFIQPQFDRSSAEVVAQAINARLEVVDPLQENVLTFFLEMSSLLEKACSR